MRLLVGISVLEYLLNNYFFNYLFSQSFVYTKLYFFLLENKFLFQGSNMSSNEKSVVDDPDLFCISCDRLTHYIFPYITDLQSLDRTPEAALFQKLIKSVTD